MPANNEVCIDHGGCVVKIEQHENTLADHETRLREIEKQVWKASGLTGAIVLIGQVLIQHYWK